jgi:hypothetical protein
VGKRSVSGGAVELCAIRGVGQGVLPMPTVLEATHLVVGDPPASPVSFALQRGEILGLLFPPDRPPAPLLRVLAGMEQPRKGAVRYSGKARRVAIAVGGWPHGVEPQADLVLIDGLMAAANDSAARETWARLAGEREQGTSIVLATSFEDHAYRCDRVSLAMWSSDEAIHAAKKVHENLHAMVDDFLRLTEHGRAPPDAALAAHLRRLSRAARDLIAEGRRLASSFEQVLSVKRIASQLSGDLVDERVLDAVIAGEQHS